MIIYKSWKEVLPMQQKWYQTFYAKGVASVECTAVQLKELIKEEVTNLNDETLLWIIQDFINALIK